MQPASGQLTDFTAEHIEQISPEPEWPLLVCDIDGVILQFTAAFRRFLAQRSLELSLSSEGISHAIMIDRRSGDPLPRRESLVFSGAFFAEGCEDLAVYEGVRDNLHRAERGFRIVLLSNFPAAHQRARQRNLAMVGINYPLVLNVGPKGAAFKAIAARFGHPAVFIDDQPEQIDAVSVSVPSCHALQLSLDGSHEPTVKTSSQARAHLYSWDEVSQYLSDLS